MCSIVGAGKECEALRHPLRVLHCSKAVTSSALNSSTMEALSAAYELSNSHSLSGFRPHAKKEFKCETVEMSPNLIFGFSILYLRSPRSPSRFSGCSVTSSPRSPVSSERVKHGKAPTEIQLGHNGNINASLYGGKSSFDSEPRRWRWSRRFQKSVSPN